MVPFMNPDDTPPKIPPELDAAVDAIFAHAEAKRPGIADRQDSDGPPPKRKRGRRIKRKNTEAR